MNGLLCFPVVYIYLILEKIKMFLSFGEYKRVVEYQKLKMILLLSNFLFFNSKLFQRFVNLKETETK